MPARMYSRYLRHMYLNNDLSSGRYQVGDAPVSLGDIALPTFCVGTSSDHVAPWRSVCKLHLFSTTEITFVLTNGGHNAGIVSEPGRPRRHYRWHVRRRGERYLSPDEWLNVAQNGQGSWWPAWVQWLGERSGAPVDAPPMGIPGNVSLGDAPGEYVRWRAVRDGVEEMPPPPAA